MKQNLKMFKSNKFKVYGNGHCHYSKLRPDQKSIDIAIQRSRKKYLQNNAIIILRFNFLNRMKLQVPEEIELANLCLIIKNGKEHLSFYSSDLTHIIKKQKYHIQIIN